MRATRVLRQLMASKAGRWLLIGLGTALVLILASLLAGWEGTHRPSGANPGAQPDNGLAYRRWDAPAQTPAEAARLTAEAGGYVLGEMLGPQPEDLVVRRQATVARAPGVVLAIASGTPLPSEASPALAGGETSSSQSAGSTNSARPTNAGNPTAGMPPPTDTPQPTLIVVVPTTLPPGQTPVPTFVVIPTLAPPTLPLPQLQPSTATSLPVPFQFTLPPPTNLIPTLPPLP